jgi:HEAT repeat protein
MPPDDGSIELTLQGLNDPDESVRRRAAHRLADLASARSLPAPAVSRLRERLVHEADVEVWRYAVHAILPDATPESASIAALAAGHAAADIRVLACRYASRHRRPEFAAWLQPLFEDPSRRVQIAAIEAAGQCGNRAILDDDVQAGAGSVAADSAARHSFRGLRTLLTDANLRVRVAAAVAMCHLDDPAGIDELLRLSYTSDAVQRREIAAALAGLSHPQLAARRAEIQHAAAGR